MDRFEDIFPIETWDIPLVYQRVSMPYPTYPPSNWWTNSARWLQVLTPLEVAETLIDRQVLREPES